jgi:hypothetical protein
MWDKYTKLAQGERVLDNPRLLRKALKRDSKEKAKKAAAWQARHQAVADKQRASQIKCVKTLFCLVLGGGYLQ